MEQTGIVDTIVGIIEYVVFYSEEYTVEGVCVISYFIDFLFAVFCENKFDKFGGFRLVDCGKDGEYERIIYTTYIQSIECSEDITIENRDELFVVQVT